MRRKNDRARRRGSDRTKTINVGAASGSPPPLASTGGTIQPGLYELTGVTVYGQTGSSTIAAQMRVDITNNGYLFQIGSVVDDAAPMHTTEAAQDLGANTLSIQEICPASTPPNKAVFAAEAQSLVIRLTSSITVDEELALIGP